VASAVGRGGPLAVRKRCERTMLQETARVEETKLEGEDLCDISKWRDSAGAMHTRKRTACCNKNGSQGGFWENSPSLARRGAGREKKRSLPRTLKNRGCSFEDQILGRTLLSGETLDRRGGGDNIRRSVNCSIDGGPATEHSLTFGEWTMAVKARWRSCSGS